MKPSGLAWCGLVVVGGACLYTLVHALRADRVDFAMAAAFVLLVAVPWLARRACPEARPRVTR